VPGSSALLKTIGFDEDIANDYFNWNESFDVKQSIQVLENQLRLLNIKIDSIPRKPMSGASIPSTVSMAVPPTQSYRYAVGYSESIGIRPSMEDELVILGLGPRIRENEDYFAVFDGHGGPRVSEFCAKILHKKIRNSLAVGMPPIESLKQAFLETDELVKEEKVCGSTALVALILDNILYVANIGDTRAVLGSKGLNATRLSVDHKPSLQSEKERICQIGGSVQMLGGVWRVNGVLAVSRSFGDYFLKPFVIAEPFISETQLTDEHLFLVLACDGVWDVLSDEQVVCIVSQVESPDIAAEIIRRTAFTRGSEDNISVIVIYLQDPSQWK